MVYAMAMKYKSTQEREEFEGLLHMTMLEYGNMVAIEAARAQQERMATIRMHAEVG